MKYLFLSLFSLAAMGQVADSYYLPQNITYNTAIPTPQSFLGYQVGEQHATPAEIVAYMKELDRVSDRISLETYALTFEKKPCVLLTITSAANHQNIEKIKADHQKLTTYGGAGLNIQNMPVVVWMGYSVHGNEPSGTNAALMVAYYLAAATGPSVDSLLSESIILLDPVINPDGGTRFANWVNQNKGQVPNADPNTRELQEPFPMGRTNHYWFDLNRDWLHQQMPESRGRLVKFYDWRPNFLTDHHEMGSNSSFFFQPGVPKRTHPMTPAKNIDLTNQMGAFHAKFLDAIGSKYYTQENYDDFYYGKGSTLPDVNGAVGVLFEQASSRGHLRETSNGPLSFPFTIRNQVTATFSTLAAAKAMRKDMLDYMQWFYSQKPANISQSVVFGANSDKAKTAEMVNVLLRNKIQVHELGKDLEANGQKFKTDNAFVVPYNQAQHRLITALFEKRTKFEDSLFYDISAFHLGFSMGVPYADNISATLGKKMEQPLSPKGQVIGTSKLAYAFDWAGYFSPKTANELLKKGYMLKVATQSFTGIVNGQGKEFRPGTVVVYLENADKAKADLTKIAERDGIDFYGIETGLTPTGIDLGSEGFKRIRAPRVAVLTGFGATNNEAGEVWHLLDTRMDIPTTLLDIDAANRVDLSKYTHIVLAGGGYGTLSDNKIKQFVQNGGTLVALTDSPKWLIDKGLANVKLKTKENRNTPRPWASSTNDQGALETSGTILEVTADLSNPLFYGYDSPQIPVFKDNNLAMEPVSGSYDNPAVFSPNMLLAGYLHPENKKVFTGAASIITQSLGSGRMILTTENPNFRAYWYGTNKIFMNSLFFGPLLGNFSRFSEDN